MVEDRPDESVVKPNQTFNKRTLLCKYEIPIDHLSYEYINVCSNVKELEKIIKILRSGEEGFYPHLEATAEERLRSLSPNSILLRRAEPALHIHDMDIKERTSVIRDVASWKEEISMRDLKLSEENQNTCEEVSLPPIRQPSDSAGTLDKKEKSANKNENMKVSKVGDYAAWDKYDADTELLKIELEEERERLKKKKEKEEEMKRLEKMRIENERLNVIVQEAGKMSITEREILAEEEKNRGNEYFHQNQYHEAVKYYSASIAVLPTVKALNNRAAAYIQLKEYSPAADDANAVLSIDPNNVKAHYRRALTLQHKGQYEEAYEDVNCVILKEPHNALAKKLTEELKKQISESTQIKRSAILEGSSSQSKIVELPDDCKIIKQNQPKDTAWMNIVQEPNSSKTSKNKGCRGWFPSTSTGSVASKAKIIELPDESNDHNVYKSASRLEIVEVEKSENKVQLLNTPEAKVEPSHKVKKCVVIDKRTVIPGANGN